MSVKRNFVDVSHGQMHYRYAGEQALPALICLHMMPKSSRGFTHLMAELEKQYFVLSPDFPGYGESDFYPEGQPGIEDYASSILEFMDAMALSKAHLLGYHTGSKVAVELAHQAAERVLSVVCISAPIMTAAEVDQLHDYFQPIPLDAAGTRYQIMWQRVQEFAGPGMNLEMCAESMAENLRGGERYEEGHIAAFNYSGIFPERLKDISAPLKVFNIGDDLYQQTKRVGEFIDGSAYLEKPDWGHGFLQLHAEEFAELLSEFINSV